MRQVGCAGWWVALAITACVGGATILGGEAWAAGIEYPEMGAVAVGRGGAVAAKPEDGLALMFNPAGLAWSHGWGLVADGKLMWNNVSYTASDPSLVSHSSSPTSSNNHVFYATPTDAVLTYAFGAVGPFDNLAVGLGVVGPSATGKLSYDVDGVQRYQKTLIDYFIAYYSAGVAARIGQAWGIGATFQLAQGTAKFSQAARSVPNLTVADDIQATVDVKSSVIPTGVVGLTFVPHPQWAFGLSYRPKIAFHADGTLTSVFPDSQKGLNPVQTGDSATLRLAFPHVVRLGAQYTPWQAWLVEANIVYERWTVFDAAEVVPHGITVAASQSPPQPLTDIVFPKQYHDAVSLRLGSDYEILADRLTVRAGYLYETSAIPTRTVSVDFPNWGRHAISVGATVRVFGARLNVGYAYHFVPTQTVTDSIITTVTTPPVSPTPVEVGNGTYTASVGLLAIGLSIDLDHFRVEI